MPSPSEPASAIVRARPGSRAIVALTLPLLFIVLAWPVLLGQLHIGRAAADQSRYHEPMIRTFIEQWPRPDLTDYLSATTPGYHLALAAVGRYVSDACNVLQVTGSLFTLALLGGLGWHVGGRLTTGRSIAAAAPLLASVYVFSAGIWLVPDNAGWLGVLGMLLIALHPRFTPRLCLLGGAALLGVVLIRQIHLWSAAPLVLAAFLGSDTPTTRGLAGLWRDLAGRIGRAGLALLTCVPAILALLWFYRLWDGHLVPPTFLGWYSTHLSPASAAFFLTLFAFWSIPYLGYLIAPGMRWMTACPRRTMGIGGSAALLGILFATIPETTADRHMGRFSGIWHLADRLPDIGEHTSLLILGGAPLGAVLLTGWLAALPLRSRLVFATGVVSFIAAQTVSPQLWQRYYEPFVLLLLPLLAAHAHQREKTIPPASGGRKATGLLSMSQVLGPLALAGVLGTVTLITFLNSTPPPPGEGPRIEDPTETDGFYRPPGTDSIEGKCSSLARRREKAP